MRQFTCPKAVTHPSTNQAQCKATALIETNALPLHQTANLQLFRLMALCRLLSWKSRPTPSLAGCRTRRLNQALSVMSLSLGLFESVVLFTSAPFCIVLFVCSVSWLCLWGCHLSAPVWVIDWKDSFLKWPIMCWWDVKPYWLTQSLTLGHCLFFQLVPSIWKLNGSVKEPNILIYFFSRPSLSGFLFPMFCLLMDGKCQILVF